MIVRTPEEQAKDAKRRRWARAVARGFALGGLCAALAGWPGPLVGLVATPLAFVEAWGGRRNRPKTAALLAWTVAVVWLAGVHLQVTFVSAMHGAGPQRGDLGAAFEAVRLEAVHVSRVSAATDDDLRGAVFVIGAMLLSMSVAYRLDRKRVMAGAGPILVSAALLLPSANPFVIMNLVGFLLWGGLAVVFLAFFARVTDAAVDRVLDRCSHLDGGPDG